MRHLFYCLFILIYLSLMGCDVGPESPRGFSLPPGDINKGASLLVKHQCLACHYIEGFEQAKGINNPDINVRLGGALTHVKTYAELVTSVINPSHKLTNGYPLAVVTDNGVSKMENYNDVMTITELIDLVAFLQSNYSLVPYRSTNYQFYGY